MVRQIIVTIVLCTGALLLAPVLTARADRYEFRVVGVGRSDTLNIRERVESQDDVSDTKVLGRIPAKSDGVVGTGASQKVGGSRGFEVRYGDVRGWVNGRYLAPVSSSISHALESNLFCAGTDPAWSLRIEDQTAEIQQAGDESAHYKVTEREAFQGRSDALALRLGGTEGPDVTALIRHKEWCKDGMSNLEYAFDVVVLGVHHSTTPLRGCCSLLR